MNLVWLREELDRHVCSRALGATRYRSPEAVNMLAAIALQESWCNALFQRDSMGVPIRHLARSPWQLEPVAVVDLGSRPSTRRILEELEPGLGWQAQVAPKEVWERAAWDVVLACRLARALLWTVPEPLPSVEPWAEEQAWRQYLSAWRPGRPSRQRWRAVWEALLPR